MQLSVYLFFHCGQSHLQLTLTSRPTNVFFFPPMSSFFIVSPTDQQVHCWSWIKKHMPNDPQLHLEDVSWKYTGNQPGPLGVVWHIKKFKTLLWTFGIL